MILIFSVQTTISGLTRAENFLRTPRAQGQKKPRSHFLSTRFDSPTAASPIAVSEAHIDWELKEKSSPLLRRLIEENGGRYGRLLLRFSPWFEFRHAIPGHHLPS